MKLVIHNKGRSWGGNEKWLATVAAGLIRRGHQVIVSCPPGPVEAELRRREIPTTPIRPGGILQVADALRFTRWLRSEQPDALLLTSWTATFWGSCAGKWADINRIVVRLGIVRTLKWPLEAVAFRYWVDAMVVNSAQIRDAWLRASRWYPAGSIKVILNSVDVTPPPGANLRAEIRADPSDILIAGVGHLSPRKGFDVLIAAFAMAAIPGARAVIVGEGAERTELEALADRLDVGERVHFLGGRPDGAAILGASDIFVLSSRNEGMANVLLEAMAAEVPVVATDVSGVVEALGPTADRPDAGWIVPRDDPAKLAEVLRLIAADLRGGRHLVRPRIAEASRRVRDWFTADRMLDDVERVLFPDPAPRKEAGPNSASRLATEVLR